MNFSDKCLVGLLALFLIATPAVAQIELTGGPNAASSAGGFAIGGPTVIQFTAPGVRVLASALWAFATVPAGNTGWAYADFTTNGQTVQADRTFQSLIPGVPDQNANLYYNGRVAARVDKTAEAGTATAVSGMGSAVGRLLTFGPPAIHLAGTAVQFSLLSLPAGAHGYAQTNGFAGYNINNIGNTVISGGGTIASSEPARCYGNTLGSTDVVGTNVGAGLALIGTASYAYDPIGQGAGRGVSASALGSFVNAIGAGIPASPIASSFNAVIRGNIAGSEATAESGEWDGSTPIGTFEQTRVNENSHSQVSGALRLATNAHVPTDFATAGGLVMSLGLHTASPAIDPDGQQLLKALFNPVETETDDGQGPDHPTDADYHAMLGLLGDAGLPALGNAMHLFGTIDGTDLGMAGDAFMEQGDKMLDKANPFLDPKEDPTVAATIVATGATVSRGVFGPQTRVTAESFVDGADVSADARDSNPTSSHASAENGNFGSGAHLVYGSSPVPYQVGSAALSAQVAFAAPNFLPKADLSLFAEGTWGPGLTGRIEDDAGSYANMQNNVMSARFASTEYRTTTPELWVFNWEQGADPLHNLYYRVPHTTFVPPGTAGLPLVVQGSTLSPTYRYDLLVYPTVNVGV